MHPPGENLGSATAYVCFTTTSLATVDMYLLLWLCTTCRYHTTVLGTRALEVRECSLWSGCVRLTPALYCAVPQICAYLGPFNQPLRLVNRSQNTLSHQ